MFLKIISIENLDFHNTWLSGIEKIKRLSLFDKYMTIFWLIGPFIYLIERDPADLWLTLIGITFLFSDNPFQFILSKFFSKIRIALEFIHK